MKNTKNIVMFNMIPGISTWIGGDTHLYVNHIPQVKEQIKRIPKKLPELEINKKLNSLEDIEKLSINDFELKNYDSYPAKKLKQSSLPD
jgi:thymidylate synthase